MSTARERLDQARQQLFDLTPHNPLLNDRLDDEIGLKLVSERPLTIFRLLVDENDTMYFANSSADSSFMYQSGENHHADTFIQTPYEAK